MNLEEANNRLEKEIKSIMKSNLKITNRSIEDEMKSRHK